MTFNNKKGKNMNNPSISETLYIADVQSGNVDYRIIVYDNSKKYEMIITPFLLNDAHRSIKKLTLSPTKECGLLQEEVQEAIKDFIIEPLKPRIESYSICTDELGQQKKYTMTVDHKAKKVLLRDTGDSLRTISSNKISEPTQMFGDLVKLLDTPNYE